MEDLFLSGISLPQQFRLLCYLLSLAIPTLPSFKQLANPTGQLLHYERMFVGITKQNPTMEWSALQPHYSQRNYQHTVGNQLPRVNFLNPAGGGEPGSPVHACNVGHSGLATLHCACCTDDQWEFPLCNMRAEHPSGNRLLCIKSFITSK